MFRILLRSVAINLAGMYIVIQILSGTIVYVGGIKTLIMVAAAISLINLFIRPIVNLLLLPINLLLVGLFRWVANLVTLYLITRFFPNFQIHASNFAGLDLGYLIIPPFHLSIFGAFILTTLTLTIVFHLLYWLFQD